MALDPGSRKELEGWLETFSDCVRRADVAAARQLFAASLRGFGTRVFCAEGRDAVEREQWQYVWPRTRDFSFELESLEGWLSQDSTQACVALPWRSTGFDADGAAFARRGRATLLLAHTGSGWTGMHTHFSIDPAVRDPLLDATR